MGKYDDMLRDKGEICRWLTDDDWFHMVDCRLNIERMHVLSDRFKELGLKHSEYAYEYVVQWCKYEDCPHFESRKKDDSEDADTEDIEDAEDREAGDFFIYTKVELAAIARAKEEFRDDDVVRKTYQELKEKSISRREKDARETLAKLELERNEPDF